MNEIYRIISTLIATKTFFSENYAKKTGPETVHISVAGLHVFKRSGVNLYLPSPTAVVPPVMESFLSGCAKR